MTAKQLAAANEIIAEQNRTIATLSNGNGAGEIMESVIVKGDLSRLTPEERSQYYMQVCKSVGLNPLTKPFEYISLNGKLVLYALRACTDQLRSIHKVSVESLEESERDGVFIVTAKMRNGEGRTDMAKGAVTLGQLKGDALANAIMKAETKAKRRATLSLCGLGWLDESEIETIPHQASRQTLPKKDSRDIYSKLQGEIDAAQSVEDLQKWGEANRERIAVLPNDWQDILRLRYQENIVGLRTAGASKQSNLAKPSPQGNGKPMPSLADDPAAWLSWVDDKMSYITTIDVLRKFWDTRCAPNISFPPDEEAAREIYEKHIERINPPADEQV